MDGHVAGTVPQGYAGAVTGERGFTAGLPAELLVEIFAILPFWDRVRTATVCRRWRSVSLEAAGQLWSTIIGPGDVVVPRDVDACRGLLDRARRTLVTFVIRDMHEGNFKELGEMLLEHLPHIKDLDITLLPHPFGSWEATPRVVSGISSTLEARAPVLKRIRIVNCAPMEITGLSILQGPELHTIELSGVDLWCLRTCAGSSELRTLIVDTHATRWNTGFNWPMICSFPRLETLAVCIANPGIPDVSQQRRPFPPTLKRLSLSLRPETLAQLTIPGDFARLHVWQLAFINSASLQHAKLSQLLPYLQNITPASAAVQFDGAGMHIMLTSPAGRTAAVQGVQFDGSWTRPLARATALCIGGLGSLPTAVVNTRTPLPSVERLTIDVTPESAAFASNTFRWPRLACPSLRAVCLRSAIVLRTIPLAAVKTLLQDSLDAGPGSLAELVLHNVNVSAQPDIDVSAALHDLAETVTMLETGGIWPECHLSWRRPWCALNGCTVLHVTISFYFQKAPHWTLNYIFCIPHCRTTLRLPASAWLW